MYDFVFVAVIVGLIWLKTMLLLLFLPMVENVWQMVKFEPLSKGMECITCDNSRLSEWIEQSTRTAWLFCYRHCSGNKKKSAKHYNLHRNTEKNAEISKKDKMRWKKGNLMEKQFIIWFIIFFALPIAGAAMRVLDTIHSKWPNNIALVSLSCTTFFPTHYCTILTSVQYWKARF